MPGTPTKQSMKTFLPTEIEDKILEFLEKHPDGVLEIFGPTASGKTGYSIKLAQWLEQKLKKSAEILSVDSRQVFRHIDVSSAKITTEEMAGIPHHGIDIKDPNETYDVCLFQKYAFETLKDIQTRGHIPIMCGGTMLWLDAVSENYQFSEKGTKSTEKNPPIFPTLKIGLHWKRTKLYQRIDQRCEEMFHNGLIEETQKIRELFPDITLSAFTSFGYKEINAYLAGLMTLEETIWRYKQRNRKYAKRQLTWWRGREDVLWLEAKKLK